jgi:SAM-dependent methyltransferase
MLPLSEQSQESYRVGIRLREFKLIAEEIRKVLGPCRSRPRVLEFGCGRATGARALADVGSLVVSDVYRDPMLDLPPGIPFVMTDILKTSFDDDQFDVLVSNHVIEHICEGRDISLLPFAFKEMKRIAAPDAVFVFSVPTTAWQLLTVPGQISDKVANVMARAMRLLGRKGAGPDNITYGAGVSSAAKRSECRRTMLLNGHGSYKGFIEAARSFRHSRWRARFRENGFEIVSERCLLCYASAKWPIIPANQLLTKVGLCASHLFLMRDAGKLCNVDVRRFPHVD